MKNTDFITRLKAIADAQAIHSKREQFLKTDYKYPLFITLYETIQQKIKVLEEAGFKDISLLFGDLNDISQDFSREKNDIILWTDSAYLGICYRETSTTKIAEEYTEIAYKRSGGSDIHVFLKGEEMAYPVEEFLVASLGIEIDIPIQSPVILTINDDLNPLWNGLSNSELADIIISTVIKNIEQEYGL
ncbi:hypothetical protein [Dyadobacter fanqingshengii]|uniref:hypothetical protein n=1 Tax=Dyadobacter fanqingshengii TaxID=2906443 RepID=UPI0020C1A64B|nr:hypothetical protein [Dyadobacter fanqingshengii]UTM21859.1 hypothetical protein NFI81_26370 [Dyadobacter fanqingshengii]